MTHYSEVACPTCSADPMSRCAGVLGGAHATRVTKALHQGNLEQEHATEYNGGTYVTPSIVTTRKEDDGRVSD